MKRLFLLCLLIAAPVSAQQSVVETVKADVVRRGINISGECGAFEIVKRVAWTLRSQGAGLVAKPGGNNCDGFSVDLIQFTDGRWVDVLSDAGGLNGPAWGVNLNGNPEVWRAPINPMDGTGPTPTPVPTPTFTIDYGLIKSYIEFAAEQERQRDERILADDIARDGRLNQKLDAIQEKPSGGIGNPFTNRTFYELLLGGLAAAYVARQETTK